MATQTADFSPDKFMAKFGESGKTLPQFAQEVGVAPSTVTSWMTGVAAPRTATIKWAAQVLGVRVEDLMADEEAG